MFGFSIVYFEYLTLFFSILYIYLSLSNDLNYEVQYKIQYQIKYILDSNMISFNRFVHLLRLLSWKKRNFFAWRKFALLSNQCDFRNKRKLNNFFPFSCFWKYTILRNLPFAIKVIALSKKQYIVICFICHVLNE